MLDLPLVTADAAAKRLAADQLERELASLADGLVGSVRARARETMRRRRSSSSRDAEDVAAHAEAPARRAGTTYSELRDDQRRQRALLLLDDRSLSISEIAVRLGYTELPNFTRAFRSGPA